MRINLTTTQCHKSTHRPNFGWLKLCNGKVMHQLANGKQQLIPVDICLLRAEDLSLIAKTAEQWEDKTLYGTEIMDGFIEGANFPQKFNPKIKSAYYLMVRSQTDEVMSQNTPLALAAITRQNDIINIERLQASPYTKYPRRNRIHGCGQMLMYAIAKIAKSINCPVIEFMSTNHEFYQKIFNIKLSPRQKHVRIYPYQTDEFITNTQEKYHMRKEPKTISQAIIRKVEENGYDYEFIQRQLETYSK